MLEVYGLSCACPRCDEGEIRYVGKTSKGHKERLKAHFSESRNGTNTLAKSNWIRKHGEENIRSRVLHTAETDEELADMEKYMIRVMGTHGTRRGLNLTEGGEGVTGFTHSKETRAKFKKRTLKQFSEKHPRKILSDEKATEIRSRLWNGEHPADIAPEYPEVSIATIRKLEQPTYRTSVPFPGHPRTVRDPRIGERSAATRDRFEKGELGERIRALYLESGLSKTEIAQGLGVSNASVTKYTKGYGRMGV